MLIDDSVSPEWYKFSHKLVKPFSYRDVIHFVPSKSGNPNKWFTTLSYNAFDRQRCVSAVSILPYHAEPEVREAASEKHRKSKMGPLLLSLNRIETIAPSVSKEESMGAP